MLRNGAPPTVAEVAEKAKVSRATAYRYFPTQEALLLEISDIGPAVAPIEALLGGMMSSDAEERLLLLHDTFGRMVLKEEAVMRTSLRVYLDTWLESQRNGGDIPPLRAGRRMRWLDQALAPIRPELTEEQWHRLKCGLALTLGTEAVVVMKDVCHVTGDDEILAILRWVTTAVLRAALADVGPGN